MRGEEAVAVGTAAGHVCDDVVEAVDRAHPQGVFDVAEVHVEVDDHRRCVTGQRHGEIR